MFLKYLIICSHVYSYSNKSLTPPRRFRNSAHIISESNIYASTTTHQLISLYSPASLNSQLQPILCTIDLHNASPLVIVLVMLIQPILRRCWTLPPYSTKLTAGFNPYSSSPVSDPMPARLGSKVGSPSP